MIDALGAPFQRYLASHRHGVIVGHAVEMPCPLVVSYRADGLEIDCLLPRWADLTYQLEQDPRVTLVIPAPGQADCWLQVDGTGRPVETPDWSALAPQGTFLAPPTDLYRVIRVYPTRLDLYDGQRGWGARETLELLPGPDEA